MRLGSWSEEVVEELGIPTQPTDPRQMRRQSAHLLPPLRDPSGPLLWLRQLLGHKRNNWQQTHPTIFSPSPSVNCFYQGPFFSEGFSFKGWEGWLLVPFGGFVCLSFFKNQCFLLVTRDAKSEEHEERAPAIFPPAVLIFGLPTQKIC